MVKRNPNPDPQGGHTKRKGRTPEQLERLRQSTLARQPWRFSTGPRTPEGKARSALNGKARRKGNLPMWEVKAELAGLADLASQMEECCRLAARPVVEEGST
jgi:hypothetical protein